MTSLNPTSSPQRTRILRRPLENARDWICRAVRDYVGLPGASWRMNCHAKPMECVQLAGAFGRQGWFESGSRASPRSKRFAQFGCVFALHYPGLLAGWEDLAPRRRESQRFADRYLLLCVSPRSSASLRSDRFDSLDELPREAHGVRPACWRCRTPRPNQSASKLHALATPVICNHEVRFLINTSLQRGERGPWEEVQPLQRFFGPS